MRDLSILIQIIEQDREDKCKGHIRTIELCDNFANGDLLKSLFPYASVIIDNDDIVFSIENTWCFRFNKKWWNAPYKENKDVVD